MQCNMVDCPVVQCGPGEELIQPEGRCCEECSKTRQLRCLHHGRVYQVWAGHGQFEQGLD